MRTAFLMLLYVTSVGSQVAMANDISCTQVMAMSAENEADILASWESFHASYMRYKACDDGAIAEGYSDSTVRLLLEGWDGIDSACSLFRKDNGFKKFVLRHINVLMTPAQAKQINRNLTQSCPRECRSFCSSVKKRMDELVGNKEILPVH